MENKVFISINLRGGFNANHPLRGLLKFKANANKISLI